MKIAASMFSHWGNVAGDEMKTYEDDEEWQFVTLGDQVLPSVALVVIVCGWSAWIVAMANGHALPCAAMLTVRGEKLQRWL